MRITRIQDYGELDSWSSENLKVNQSNAIRGFFEFELWHHVLHIGCRMNASSHLNWKFESETVKWINQRHFSISCNVVFSFSLMSPFWLRVDTWWVNIRLLGKTLVKLLSFCWCLKVPKAYFRIWWKNLKESVICQNVSHYYLFYYYCLSLRYLLALYFFDW